MITDSYDNIVHLLDSTGEFLKINMFEDDVLYGMNCIEMDKFGWLHLDCNDGYL